MAADEYAKAHSQDPLVTEGRSSFSAKELAADLATHETPEGLYHLIRSTTRLGEEYFDNLQTRYPDSASAHQLRGDVYRLLGQSTLAANALGESKQLQQSSLKTAVAKIGDAESLEPAPTF